MVKDKYVETFIGPRTVDTVMDESDESMEPKTDRVSRNKAIKYGRNWRD